MSEKFDYLAWQKLLKEKKAEGLQWCRTSKRFVPIIQTAIDFNFEFESKNSKVITKKGEILDLPPENEIFND